MGSVVSVAQYILLIGAEISSCVDANETLESIDLMVSADKTQLDAFYDSGLESDAEEEERKTQETATLDEDTSIACEPLKTEPLAAEESETEETSASG